MTHLLSTKKKRIIELKDGKIIRDQLNGSYSQVVMGKFSYVLKNTVLIWEGPLLVLQLLFKLISAFLFLLHYLDQLYKTTLFVKRCSRCLFWWQSNHYCAQTITESLESYPEVRLTDYFSKSEAKDEFKALFKDQPELQKLIMRYSLLH